MLKLVASKQLRLRFQVLQFNNVFTEGSSRIRFFSTKLVKEYDGRLAPVNRLKKLQKKQEIAEERAKKKDIDLLMKIGLLKTGTQLEKEEAVRKEERKKEEEQVILTK